MITWLAAIASAIVARSAETGNSSAKTIGPTGVRAIERAGVRRGCGLEDKGRWPHGRRNTARGGGKYNASHERRGFAAAFGAGRSNADAVRRVVARRGAVCPCPPRQDVRGCVRRRADR